MRTASLFSFLVLSACVAEEPPSPVPQAGADHDLVPSARNETTSETLAISTAAAADGNGYDRARAVEYARRYAESPNPSAAYCGSSRTGQGADCTNFVSQALWYGGMRMAYSGDADYGWWYAGSCDDGGSSRSWRQVDRLIYWLVVESRRGEFVRIMDAQPGDLVFYKLPDAYGRCTDEFTFHHSTIVTGFGERTGVPLVSYHTREVRDIPWNWTLRESGFLGLGDACSHVVVHIRD